MGRASGKVEKIEEQLTFLGGFGTGEPAEPDVHALARQHMSLAQDVEPSKLSFPAKPAFDPCLS